MRVLLVDDEKNARDVYATLLAHAGHDVITADSAESACHAVEHLRFDVAFIDLVLGGADGFDVLEHLKRHQPPARAVIVTAYHVPDAAARARALGAEALLGKPVEWEEMVRFLQPPLAAAGESR